MSLKIVLQDNHLPACPKPFVVRSILSDTLDFDGFVDIMAAGRTTLSKIDILAAMELFTEELDKQLAGGNSVKTPIGLFYLSAAGSMGSPDESFLPADQATNHELRIHFRPESGFIARVAESVHLVRADITDQGTPKVRSALSSDSSAPNSTRAGDILNVHGFNLKFDRANPQEGLFFIDAGGAETRASLYAQILPKTVVAGVPGALAAGSYSLALRSLGGGKKLREGRLEGLTVAAP